MKQPRRVEVWDLPVRVFHWAIVILVVVSFISAKLGKMELHLWSGAGVLALVLFRLVWGFIGNPYARFASFAYGPVAAIGYLRDWLRRPHDPQRRHYLGHNPVGGWMVFVLLALLLWQATIGLFANDDILFDGPLRKHVSDATTATLTSWHKRGEWIFYGLVGMHVAAVLGYLVLRRENLVGPMFTGRKAIEPEVRPVDEAPAKRPSLVLALIVLAITWGGVIAVIKLA
ncbi:MAG: cytochrome b/b6 domain-containing protein [Rhodospirillaceae bacterium]|nr:cytochrome b/b6 domain-containing protein [Rhodospirillaceae bacterium]